MKYRDIKPAVCSCCFPNLLEEQGFGLSFNRDQFYANMRLLIDTGISSDLEGVDTLVRLGYLEDLGFDEIFDRFELEHPAMSAISRGSFSPGEDRIRMTYEYVFSQGSIGSGTSTLAHELRHRAFHIISVTPQLAGLMPSDLQNRWKDGWGNRQHGLRKWRYDGTQASPEHAMIYAIQFRDPMNTDRAVFFENPALEGESVQYWRDLYVAAESAVKGWLKNRVKVNAPDSVPTSEAPIFRMDPQMVNFYRSLGSLSRMAKLDLASDLTLMTEDSRTLWTNTLLSRDRDDPVRMLFSNLNLALFEQNYTAVPDLIQQYKRLRNQIQDPVADDFDRWLERFERSGVTWRVLDPRSFTQAEFDAMVTLNPGLLPAVPVERAPVASATPVAPRGTAAAGTPANTEPPVTVVVPTGNTIGFYQWAVSNDVAGDNLWNLIISSGNLNNLRMLMSGVIDSQIWLSKLTLDAENTAIIQAMYTVLENNGYDKNVVAQMLARVKLVKR